MSLTAQELKVLNLLADALIAYHQLEPYRPSDAPEFDTAIHAAQAIVMSRVAVRSHRDLFPRASSGKFSRRKTGNHICGDRCDADIGRHAKRIEVAEEAARKGDRFWRELERHYRQAGYTIHAIMNSDEVPIEHPRRHKVPVSVYYVIVEET